MPLSPFVGTLIKDYFVGFALFYGLKINAAICGPIFAEVKSFSDIIRLIVMKLHTYELLLTFP